jgi:hypothetical protein
MVINATFSNISVISWRSILWVEETDDPAYIVQIWLRCTSSFIIKTICHNNVHISKHDYTKIAVTLKTHTRREPRFSFSVLFFFICEFSTVEWRSFHKIWIDLRLWELLTSHCNLGIIMLRYMYIVMTNCFDDKATCAPQSNLYNICWIVILSRVLRHMFLIGISWSIDSKKNVDLS